MVFKNFRLNCTFRVVLLCGTFSLFMYMIQNTQLYASLFVVGILFVYQVVALIRYVEMANRKVTNFLQSITYSDFSQNFHAGQRGRSFDELNKAFNHVINKFQQTRAEKEEHYRYLQTVVQNIGIGLIILTDSGEIDLINNAAKRLLNVRRLAHLNHLKEIDPDLPGTFRNSKGGKQFLLKLNRNDQSLTFIVFTTDFIQQERCYRLVTIQNIQSELEEKEMEAWQNLIRILTHEIMNSVTPIISLASTANTLLKEETKQFGKKCDDWLPDIRDAIGTIEHRSESLLQFVENYRKLTRVPKPDFEIFAVKELFDRVVPLYQNGSKKSVTLIQSIQPESLEITADRNLVEQVMINVLKNAVESLVRVEHPEIRVTAEMNDLGRPVIKIQDNGPGIEPHVIPNIFIPFFTTKEKGSGIGLSLSRQIMRLHGGSLSVYSRPGEATVFRMQF